MLKIPSQIFLLCDGLLLKAAVPERFHFFYKKWLRYHYGLLSQIRVWAVKKAKLPKRASAHTFRHSFAGHLLQANDDGLVKVPLISDSRVLLTPIKYRSKIRVENSGEKYVVKKGQDRDQWWSFPSRQKQRFCQEFDRTILRGLSIRVTLTERLRARS